MICIYRIISAEYFSAAFLGDFNKKYCLMSVSELMENSTGTEKISKRIMIGLGVTTWQIVFKVCFGISILGMIVSFTIKIYVL
jgi:hypothetical protein